MYRCWASIRFYKTGAHRIAVRFGKLRCDQYMYNRTQYNGQKPRWVTDGKLQHSGTGYRQMVMDPADFTHEFTGLNPLLDDVP